jgi:hypothetical protein
LGLATSSAAAIVGAEAEPPNILAALVVGNKAQNEQPLLDLDLPTSSAPVAVGSKSENLFRFLAALLVKESVINVQGIS